MELSKSNSFPVVARSVHNDQEGSRRLNSSTGESIASSKRQHALVIGASFSGLMTARVLLKHFERVTILEKDTLDFDQPVYRKGQPQTPHQHLLLLRGRELIESYFPGFNAGLDQQGVGRLDYGGAVSLHLPEGDLPRYPSGIELRPCRRVLIDYLLLNDLECEPNIQFVDGVAVTGLKYDHRQETVCGVECLREEERFDVEADLVVDCSGRGSRLTKWLDALGFDVPAVSKVDAKLGYASRRYVLPEGVECEALDIAPDSPNHPYAAGLWPVENGQWLLTLIGMNGELPPKDEAGFQAFSEKLLDSRVTAFINAATPVSDIVSHRGTANVWRQYQNIEMPDGILAVGDAVCAYNPLHGQGISVSATVAAQLDRWLAKQAPDRTISSRFFARSYWIYLQAWCVAVSEDLRWPRVQVEHLRLRWLLKIAHRYVDRVLKAAMYRPSLVKTCLEVTNMKRSPLALVSPKVLWQVFGSGKEKVRTQEPPELQTQHLKQSSKQHPTHNSVRHLSDTSYFTESFLPELQDYQAQWGEQSSSYFGCQARCRYFVIKGVGYIPFATYRVGFKKINVVPTRPVCAPEFFVTMVEQLEVVTGHSVLLIGVDADCKNRLAQQGYGFAQLGREFQTRLEDFKVQGKSKKHLRWASNIGKRGFVVREQTWAEVDGEQVRKISKQWRRSKTFRIRELEMLTRPPVFSDEHGVRKFFCYHDDKLIGFVFFDPFYRDGKVIGYCANILRADLSVRPNGFLDYTLLEAIKVFRKEGIENISLGMAPLYGVEPEANDIALVRGLARLIYRYGNSLYAFQALAYHKQRYRMQETPWYICYRDLSLPSVTFATARACRVV